MRTGDLGVLDAQLQQPLARLGHAQLPQVRLRARDRLLPRPRRLHLLRGGLRRSQGQSGRWSRDLALLQRFNPNISMRS